MIKYKFIRIVRWLLNKLVSELSFISLTINQSIINIEMSYYRLIQIIINLSLYLDNMESNNNYIMTCDYIQVLVWKCIVCCMNMIKYI